MGCNLFLRLRRSESNRSQFPDFNFLTLFTANVVQKQVPFKPSIASSSMSFEKPPRRHLSSLEHPARYSDCSKLGFKEIGGRKFGNSIEDFRLQSPLPYVEARLGSALHFSGQADSASCFHRENETRKFKREIVSKIAVFFGVAKGIIWVGGGMIVAVFECFGDCVREAKPKAAEDTFLNCKIL